MSQPVKLRHKVSHFVTNCDTRLSAASDQIFIWNSSRFTWAKQNLEHGMTSAAAAFAPDISNECYKSRNKLSEDLLDHH